MFTLLSFFNSRWHDVVTSNDLAVTFLIANKLKAVDKNGDYAVVSNETGEIIFEI